jgi:hypothetical protein
LCFFRRLLLLLLLLIIGLERCPPVECVNNDERLQGRQLDGMMYLLAASSGTIASRKAGCGEVKLS